MSATNRADACRKRVQCAKCPWKVTTNPHEIPHYDVEKHHALRGTIASDPLASAFAPELRLMTCHETRELVCIGWLEHQLGPGNNIGLRIAARSGRFGTFETVGEQHETFEDTLPRAEDKDDDDE